MTFYVYQFKGTCPLESKTIANCSREYFSKVDYLIC